MHKRSLYLSPEWYVLSTYEVRTKYLVLIPGYVYFYLCIENRFFFSGKCELSHVDGSLPPQQNWEPLGSCLKRPPNAVTLPAVQSGQAKRGNNTQHVRSLDWVGFLYLHPMDTSWPYLQVPCCASSLATACTILIFMLDCVVFLCLIHPFIYIFMYTFVYSSEASF